MIVLLASGIIAARALGVNYRVSAAEVSALELLTTDASFEILQALVDWPTWMRAFERDLSQKKGAIAEPAPAEDAASTSSTGPGSGPGEPV